MRNSHWDYLTYLGAATWLGTVIYVCESPHWKTEQPLHAPAPTVSTPALERVNGETLEKLSRSERMITGQLERVNGETLEKLTDHELDTPEGFPDPFLEKHLGGSGNAEPADRK